MTAETSAKARPRSMRAAIATAFAAAVVLPVVFVIAFGALSGSAQDRLAERVLRVARAVAADEASADRRARDGELEVTLFDLDGAVQEHFAEAPHRRNALGVPSIAAHRVVPERPSLGSHIRERVTDAGEYVECTRWQDDALRCSGAVQSHAGIVLVQGHAARGLERLLDPFDFGWGRPLVFFALFAFAFALVATWWLTGRAVAPLRELRAQVVARTTDVVETTPLQLSAPREIEDVANSFNRLLAALDKERAYVDELLQDLAHELKSPLAAIRTSLTLLDGAADDARASHLSRVGASVQRIDETVAKLLELSRAEAGSFLETPQAVDFAAIADAHAQALEDESSREVTWVVECEPGAMVHGAPNALGRMVRCLVENALHFADAEVRVAAVSVGDLVRLEVHDDGPGVDASDTERVFERFVARRQGGTGIGLALVHAVAAAHGGRAWCEPGPGGHFFVELPSAE